MEYLIHISILIGIYLIFAQSFNLSFGLGRLLNLAHVSSYAIGAYTTALLSTKLEAGFFSCILASAALAGFFSILIGAISIKLEKEYFLIGTLAFNSLVIAILINWRELTNGVLGIAAIPRPEIFGIDFYQSSNFLILVLLLDLLSLFFLYIIFRNSFGRKLHSLSEFERGARVLNINAREIKNLSFFIASFFSGLAGSIFAYYLNYIDPSSFNLSEMIFVLSIVVIGQPGSFWGAIGATFFLVILPEPLRFITLSPGVLGPARQFLYGAILFLVVALRKDKIFPVERRV